MITLTLTLTNLANLVQFQALIGYNEARVTKRVAKSSQKSSQKEESGIDVMWWNLSARSDSTMSLDLGVGFVATGYTWKTVGAIYG